MSSFKIKLGTKVKDNITGFSGMVTGRCEYLTGCRQYSVAAKASKGKGGETTWFDEDRLLKSIPKPGAGNDGGPQQNPAPTK